MKIYVDRNTISPYDLKISDNFDVEWMPAPRAPLGDPQALAQVILAGINDMQAEKPGVYIEFIKQVRAISGWDLRGTKAFCDALRGHFDPDWRARQ
jgi:hypothetical protein